MRIWLLVTVVFLGACWASFPDERMAPDGSSPTDAGQQDVTTPNPDQTGADTGTQDKDKGQPDLTFPDIFQIPDSFTCTPATFVQCVGKDKLQRCNKKGDGVVVESCAPFECNPTDGRCNECDPNGQPFCVGKDLATCTAAGLVQTTPCSLGCKNGVCCNNIDQDTHTDCDGDCNDNDPMVFPGQTAWQTTDSNGSFDYNCDNTEEPQYPGTVACKIDKGSCIGEGWTGTAPACGKGGMLSTCKKQGNKCVVDGTSLATQGCR